MEDTSETQLIILPSVYSFSRKDRNGSCLVPRVRSANFTSKIQDRNRGRLITQKAEWLSVLSIVNWPDLLGRLDTQFSIQEIWFMIVTDAVALCQVQHATLLRKPLLLVTSFS